MSGWAAPQHDTTTPSDDEGTDMAKTPTTDTPSTDPPRALLTVANKDNAMWGPS